MNNKIVNYLESKGVEILRDDGQELACYCPFHSNSSTPAFYINKITGLWICFNPSCGKRGSLKDLREFFGDSMKVVIDHSIDDIELALIEEEAESPEHWDDTLDKILVRKDEIYKVSYLLDRGFSPDVILYFEIGFSEKKGRIVIPVRDERHHIAGLIGRAISSDVQPKYLYSKGFPRKSVLFNLNNAKRSTAVIVVEGSLDAIKVHQAGYPNVVATLGAAVTDQHAELLRRYFNEVIIFSDNDHAGYAMRDLIIDKCSAMNLKIVDYPDSAIKDPGDMNDSQIAKAICQAEDYLDWTLG